MISGTLPNIKITKFIWNLCKRPNTANVHFHFLVGIYNLKSSDVRRSLWPYLQIPWRNAWTFKMLAALDGLRIFHLKNVSEPIEYSRCLQLPCFNKFVLTQKIFNCFVPYKTIPTLPWKDRRWCPDKAPVFWSPI